MISAFVGVAEVLAARRRTANRCVTRLCTSENLLSQGRQLWIVFCSLLIVAFITDALVRFIFFICGRDLQLGAIAALHMDAQIDPPRKKRYCPLFSFFINYVDQEIIIPEGISGRVSVFT